jgi:uncharacterized protein YehS (DUF1456 family)
VTNNDILRRIRYTFDFNDSKMIQIFSLAGLEVSRQAISDWLKKEDDSSYKSLSDEQLASFLNGLIVEKRGKKDGPQPVPEKVLNNNIVFRKLKIALDMQSDDVLNMLATADLKISKHELSAFFRKPDHKHYRVCKDQVLRNFMKGMQLKFHPGASPDEGFKW